MQAAFLPLMRDNAATSLRDETGCHLFDIATDPGRPDEVFLYELYTDAEAFRLHLLSAHFAAFDAAVSDMIAQKDVRTYAEVIR
jgi:quinol monooxygenase YgiN